MASCANEDTILGEGVGWGVVIGALLPQGPRSLAAPWFGLMCVALLFAVGGIVFTALTMFVSNQEMKATGKKLTSEHFNTAGRNVGAGACSHSPSTARAPALPPYRRPMPKATHI